MKFFPFFAISIFMAIVLVGCGSGQVTEPVSTQENTMEENGPSMSTYSNEELGISFDYPADWVIDNSIAEQLQEGFLFESSAPLVFIVESEPNKDFANNINFVVEQTAFLAPSGLEIAEQSVEMYKTFGPNMGMSDFREVEVKPFDVGNFKSGVLIGEYVLSQTGTELSVMQLIVPFGQKVYNLTMTVKREDYPTYRPVFDKIAESFKIEM